MQAYYWVVVLSLISCTLGAIPLLGRNGPCSAHPLSLSTTPQTLFASNIGTAPLGSFNCGVDSVAGSVWYSFAVPTGTAVSLTTCNAYTNYNTVIVVYTGDCQQPVCQTTSPISSCSTVNWISTGEYTLVAVAANGDYYGNYALTYSMSAVSASSCLSPIALPIQEPGLRIFGSTALGVNGDELCTSYHGFPIVWYSVTVPGDLYYDVVFDGCSRAQISPILALYGGSCSSLTCITWSCSVYQTLAPGTYYLAVLVKSSVTQDFGFKVSFAPVLPTSCQEPGTFLDLHYGFGYAYDSLYGQEPVTSNNCGTAVGPAFWSSLYAEPDRNVTIASCFNSQFDARITVYEGTCSGLICVPTTDLSAHCDGRNGTAVSFITKDAPYSVVVTSSDGSLGTFELQARYADNPYYWYGPFEEQ